jgi:hypothetical protein
MGSSSSSHRQFLNPAGWHIYQIRADNHKNMLLYDKGLMVSKIVIGKQLKNKGCFHSTKLNPLISTGS